MSYLIVTCGILCLLIGTACLDWATFISGVGILTAYQGFRILVQVTNDN